MCQSVVFTVRELRFVAMRLTINGGTSEVPGCVLKQSSAWHTESLRQEGLAAVGNVLQTEGQPLLLTRVLHPPPGGGGGLNPLLSYPTLPPPRQRGWREAGTVPRVSGSCVSPALHPGYLLPGQCGGHHPEAPLAPLQPRRAQQLLGT